MFRLFKGMGRDMVDIEIFFESFMFVDIFYEMILLN